MKKTLMVLLLACTWTAAQAEWRTVWYEPNGGGTIYFEDSTMQFSGAVTAGTNPFIRATIHTNYQNSVNTSRVCYPSANDCQWKRINVTVTYDWSCNNVVRMHANDEQWDAGPVSESYDPGRPGYNIPEPRPHVAAPTPASPGVLFRIDNEPGLMAAQAAICANWPK